MTLLDYFAEISDPDFLLSVEDDEPLEPNRQQTELEREQAEMKLERLRAQLQAMGLELDENGGE